MNEKKQVPPRQKKRPYRLPKLTVHGDLKRLTRVTKGGCMADGSKPATRNSGTAG